jgi:hypothetical protein
MWHVGVGAYHEKLLVNGGSSSLEQVVSSLRNCKQCRWQIAEFQLDSSLRPMKFFSVAFIYIYIVLHLSLPSQPCSTLSNPSGYKKMLPNILAIRLGDMCDHGDTGVDTLRNHSLLVST